MADKCLKVYNFLYTIIIVLDFTKFTLAKGLLTILGQIKDFNFLVELSTCYTSYLNHMLIKVEFIPDRHVIPIYRI